MKNKKTMVLILMLFIMLVWSLQISYAAKPGGKFDGVTADDCCIKKANGFCRWGTPSNSDICLTHYNTSTKCENYNSYLNSKRFCCALDNGKPVMKEILGKYCINKNNCSYCCGEILGNKKRKWISTDDSKVGCLEYSSSANSSQNVCENMLPCWSVKIKYEELFEGIYKTKNDVAYFHETLYSANSDRVKLETELKANKSIKNVNVGIIEWVEDAPLGQGICALKNEYIPPKPETPKKVCCHMGNDGKYQKSEVDETKCVDEGYCNVLPLPAGPTICSPTTNQDFPLLNNCSGENNYHSLYTICQNEYINLSCDENLKIKFVGPNSDTILKRGLGFVNSVELNALFKCEGSFDYVKWFNDKQKFQKILDKYKKYGQTEQSSVIDNYLMQMDNMFNEWKNYNLIYDFDPKVTLRLVNKKINNQEVINLVGNKYRRNKPNLNLIGKFKLGFTTEIKEKFYPTMAYYDTKDHKVYNVPGISRIPLEEKLYLDNNIKPGNYQLIIEVSNLGYKKDLKIINDKCNINVNPDKFFYRTININNPFLESNYPKRKIGNNWLNNKFNFINIAKNNSISNVYEFKLDKNDIKDIRNDNKNNRDCYIGGNCEYNFTIGKYSCHKFIDKYAR